jgi:hypothetical protein
LIVTPLGGQQDYGMWKEVTTIAIEMGACTGGFGEREAK